MALMVLGFGRVISLTWPDLCPGSTAASAVAWVPLNGAASVAARRRVSGTGSIPGGHRGASAGNLETAGRQASPAQERGAIVATRAGAGRMPLGRLGRARLGALSASWP